MKISVIIPSYQHSKQIGACLDSIFAQTHRDLEVIVVNDGSTDDTLDVLKRFEERITLINQENRGGNHARNRGFAASTGALVIFVDADSLFRPDALAKLAAALEAHPEASYAYSAFRFGWKKFPSWPFDADRLRRMNYIPTMALVRRADFPGFDEALKRFQDWDVWLTMLAQGKTGVFVPEILFRVRTKPGDISSWMPSFIYSIPWKALGFVPRNVRKYEEAAAIVRKKHGL